MRGEATVRRTCARACAKGRCAGRDVAGCWLLLDWMEGAWSREERRRWPVAVREVVGGGENGSRRERGCCGCGGADGRLSRELIETSDFTEVCLRVGGDLALKTAASMRT